MYITTITSKPTQASSGQLPFTTAAEFQQLPRPQQKHYLWEAHEKGIGPRALSRLTGVAYSIVQRATSAERKYSIWGYLLVFVLLLLDFKYYDYVQQ